MSFQTRVLGAIAGLLALALLCGAGLFFHHARAVVALEVRSAFQGAVQSVGDTLRSDVQHTVTLRQVVASFQDQRHVRASLVNESGKVIVASRIWQVTDPAPRWFAQLMAPPLQTARLPIALPGFPCMVVLTSDPGNEIAEVWNHARDMFVTLALFCAAAMAVMVVAMAYVSRFLRRFQDGLRRISDGHYDTRLDDRGPPEFADLARRFNHMAGELEGFSRSNRQLYAQLQSVQEEERAGIARDLHDEVGPYLFNLQVDAKAIARLDAPGAAQLGQSVREAVIHVQEQVKGMLRQLRPVSQLEFGLEPAIHDLAAFWSRRRKGLGFDVSLAIDGRLARSQEEAAYRIAQESISNAVRHGAPGLIRIAMRRDGDGLHVLVEDDGGGLKPGNSSAGLVQSGLAGMRERAQALKGRLDVEEAPGGVRVTAFLPGAADEVAA